MLTRFYKSIFEIIIFSLCFFPIATSAGVFSGADVSGEGKITSYLGVQTQERLYYELVVGQNRYESAEKSYAQGYMAGGIGYRWYGTWHTNLLLGFENTGVSEAGLGRNRGQRFSGLYTQLTLMNFWGDKNIEYLLSYSESSEQIWSRLRLKYYTSTGLLAGPELVVTRFRDYEYQGGGLVIEKIIFPYTITTKLGVRNQQYFFTPYGGLELYFSF